MEQLGPVLAQGVLQPPPLPGTVQYSTVQYSTVQYSTVQYSTVPPPLPDQLPPLLPPGHHDSHRPLPSLHAAGRHLHRLRSV